MRKSLAILALSAVLVTTSGAASVAAGLRAALWSASGYVEGDGGLQTVSVPPTAIRIR